MTMIATFIKISIGMSVGVAWFLLADSMIAIYVVHPYPATCKGFCAVIVGNGWYALLGAAMNIVGLSVLVAFLEHRR